MLTRRQTLRALGAAGVAAPLVSACGDHGSGQADLDGSDLRLVQADVERSAGDPAAVAGVVDAMGDFTLDLWSQLPADQNLALSPYSISVALAMTANGARGATARAMDDVLHVELPGVVQRRPGRPHAGARRPRRPGGGEREEGRDRPGSRQPALRRREHPLPAGVPHGPGQDVRRRHADRGLRRGRRAGADPGQPVDLPADTRADPRDPAAGQRQRRDPAGPGQRAVLQGAVGGPLREGGDEPGRLPPRRRLVGPGAADDHRRGPDVRRGGPLRRSPPPVRRRQPRDDRRAAPGLGVRGPARSCSAPA